MSKRRCNRGKPCGKSCINKSKICRIDVSPPLASELSELVKRIIDPNVKKERREKIKADVEFFKNYSKKDLDLSEAWLKDAIKKEPDKVKSELLIRQYLAIRHMKIAELRESRIKEKRLKELVEGSPKYSSTPGSKGAIPFLDKEKELKRLDSRIEELNRKIRTLDPNTKEHYLATQERITLDQHKKGALDQGVFHSPMLKDIYEMQSFNSKPEVVLNRSDLGDRKDIVRHPDGRPLILYRGIKEEVYSDDFKFGDKNFAGKGVLGDGTYAASTPFVPTAQVTRDMKDDKWARMTAIEYAGGDYAGNLNRKVTAFSLREDANIVTISDSQNFKTWAADIVDQAKRKTGYYFADPGHAAAALGIDAYNVRHGGGEDFWVVLNRGAIIAAANSQIED